MRSCIFYFVSILLVSCSDRNLETRESSHFNQIGRSYTKKYVITDHFDRAQFSELEDILSRGYGLSDANDWDNIFCTLKEKEEILNNPLTLKYIKQKLVVSLSLDNVPCIDSADWYFRKIGIYQDGINPFIDVIVADKINYFEIYLTEFSYEEIFSKYPQLHIYAAFRKSCGIVRKLYKDRNQVPVLDSILKSDTSYDSYARERCGDI